MRPIVYSNAYDYGVSYGSGLTPEQTGALINWSSSAGAVYPGSAVTHSLLLGGGGASSTPSVDPNATKQVNVLSPGSPGLPVFVAGQQVGVTPVMVTIKGKQNVSVRGATGAAGATLDAGQTLAQAQEALTAEQQYASFQAAQMAMMGSYQPGSGPPQNYPAELSKVGQRWVLTTAPPAGTQPYTPPVALPFTPGPTQAELQQQQLARMHEAHAAREAKKQTNLLLGGVAALGLGLWAWSRRG